MFDKLRRKGFDVLTLQHAEAIVAHDIAGLAEDLENILLAVRIPVLELVKGGGGESEVTQRMRRAFQDHGWHKKNFEICKTVNGVPRTTVSHEIDQLKEFGDHTVALEIEWNTKDTFYDRDLDNFQRLHAERTISLGAIVTRGQSLHESLRAIVEKFAVQQSLQSIDDLSDYYRPTDRQRTEIARAVESQGSFAKGWAKSFVSDKFGESTTHWKKLRDRVDRGVGHPCPLVLIGLPAGVVTF